MIPPGFERLGRQATTFFLDFVATPAKTLHPDWRAALIPNWTNDVPLLQDSTALSQGLKESLGLDDDLSHFVLDDPVFQAALLPADDLQRLARHLGLALHAPRFMRVIQREQLDILGSLLTQEDWQVIFRFPQQEWPPTPFEDEDLAALVAGVEEDGLQVVLQQFRQLPHNVGQRALLKLPRREEMARTEDIARSTAVFPQVYASLPVAATDQWHNLWCLSINETVH